MFKAENGSVYIWWDKVGGPAWEHWPVQRCLRMAMYWRKASRLGGKSMIERWYASRAAEDRRAVLTAMWSARAQRQTVQIKKAA